MSEPADFDDVQRIVLHGTRWKAARHLMLAFGDRSPLHFLNSLLAERKLSSAKSPQPQVQLSLGFTRRGLERAAVPDQVLALIALKAPAYWAGAARRASKFLGMTDRNAPGHWHTPFGYMTLDAVLSVHANDQRTMDKAVEAIKARVEENELRWLELPCAKELQTQSYSSPGEAQKKARGQLVHFGFQDGLSRIGIKGWTPTYAWGQLRPGSQHEAGEFVLGHATNSGADPWIAGPGQRIWPDEVRAFFRNGSFGVLQQIEQDVAAFEWFVAALQKKTGLEIDEIKGKLCGRYPDGRSLAVPDDSDPEADFDYAADPKGYACPFGSHVRRMNPRASRSEGEQAVAAPHAQQPSTTSTQFEQTERIAHFSMSRPLLRRGLPYGPLWSPQEFAGKQPSRGLIGHFFCASIEDQFEHLLGEWADRVPMGSPDTGGARDAFIGDHQRGDGPFDIPRDGASAQRVDGLIPFTHTLGVAYLFYPSLKTMAGIAESRLWGFDDAGDDE